MIPMVSENVSTEGSLELDLMPSPETSPTSEETHPTIVFEHCDNVSRCGGGS